MNRRGFTLIELMIVVVIIGILAAMAIPRFNVASYKAKEKEADILLKAVFSSQATYRAHNGTYASTSVQLQTVGFEAPPHLANYEIPTSYALPLCVVSTGSWDSRRIDADGAITDC